MSSVFTAIDLSQLPPPDVVESLDFETILADMVDDLLERDPTLTAVNLESEPIRKLLEVAAYRELLIRQRINDASHSCMLAYATGADLDNLAANFQIKRLVLAPGNPSAVPPVPPTLESDEELRRRCTLAPEAYSTAGSEGAYLFHALSADPQVKDASVVMVSPGQVRVTVLSRVGNGIPTTALLNAVTARLSSKTVRPLTDQVTVQAVANVSFSVTATLTIAPGPDPAVVVANATTALNALLTRLRRVGGGVPRAAIIAALFVEGVDNVALPSPSADVTCTASQAPLATAISVTAA